MYTMPLVDPVLVSKSPAAQEFSNAQTGGGGAAYPAFIPALINLLADAEGALDANRLAARSSIHVALSILEAERSRHRAASATSAGVSKGGLSPWHARRIKGHIDANLGGAMLIEDLAAIAQLSARHFSLAFKQSFGQTPHAYIVRRRIEAAQRMMLSTDDPLAQIAFDCGLADQAHLSKCFRRLIGVSPAVWRKERRTWSEIRRRRDGGLTRSDTFCA
jgi:transcriptional regulator GlxA family with amidase domain